MTDEQISNSYIAASKIIAIGQSLWNTEPTDFANSGASFYHDAGEMIIDAARKIERIIGDVEKALLKS